ncbi:hypothetical protein [Jiella marina]|uniref:hypothetical protein n=1 Tax=Jiella sp. LLJ827 TaxID=2917712 RepID=UPI002100DB71|nr:hypothetical protein [Jiella sp. LLJ827]MCQ0987517.1 hypothetical protein [Jiella sp. LLJ827]
MDGSLEMPRTAATITQADVARTIRAAKQAGAVEVEIRPDGTMIVHLVEKPRNAPDKPALAWPEGLVI